MRHVASYKRHVGVTRGAERHAPVTRPSCGADSFTPRPGCCHGWRTSFVWPGTPRAIALTAPRSSLVGAGQLQLVPGVSAAPGRRRIRQARAEAILRDGTATDCTRLAGPSRSVAPGVAGLARRAGNHFCQVEPRLATIQHMGRKDKGREICINCGQTFHKKLTSKELRCTKCRKAEKKAA